MHTNHIPDDVIISDHPPVRGTQWRTLSYWKDCGGVDGVEWVNDLEWQHPKYGALWHPDGFQTWTEETGRHVPVAIVTAHACAWERH